MIKARQRQNLVAQIEKHFALDEHVKEAFLAVDREAFVPTQFKHLAYQLDALPLAASQWISSPLTVAKMTQHLELEGVDSVLEVGCGSGYQAAILSKICRRVFTIERIDELLKEAKKFEEQKVNISILHLDKYGDGFLYGEAKGLAVIEFEKGHLVLEGSEDNVFYEMTQECLQRAVPNKE